MQDSFGCEVSNNERTISSLPTHLGGLNIQNPTMTGEFHYNLSRRSTKFLIDSLKGLREFAMDVHLDTLITAHDDLFEVKAQMLEETFTITV